MTAWARSAMLTRAVFCGVCVQDTCDSSIATQASMNCDLLIHEVSVRGLPCCSASERAMVVVCGVQATYHEELRDKAISHGHSTAKMAAAYAEEVRLVCFSQLSFVLDGTDLGAGVLDGRSRPRCWC